MKPIDYAAIIERAETRRATLEEITQLLPEVYVGWTKITQAEAVLKRAHQKFSQLDDEGKTLLAVALDMSLASVRNGLSQLSQSVRSPTEDTSYLLKTLEPQEE